MWFSLNGGNSMSSALSEHIDSGGMAVVREPGRDGGCIVLFEGGQRRELLQAGEIPAALGGMADFNIANALAAAAICAAQRVPDEHIAEGLRSFSNSFEDCPGRLNVHDAHGMRFVLDYAHNPASLRALGQVVHRMRANHARTIGMVSIPGDRRDEDIIEMGRIAAEVFDEIIFREAPDGRGRAPGEVNHLMAEGALQAGAAARRLKQVVNEFEAVDLTLRTGRPGDLIVVLPTSVAEVWEQILRFVPPSSASDGHLGGLQAGAVDA